MRFPGLLSAILTVKNLVINFTQILTKMVLQQRGSLLHSFQTVVKLTCWTKVVKVHCFRCSLAILQSSKSNERQKYHSRREEEKNMNTEYGYARISTPKQNIERQVRNILAAHPKAHIIREIFTGTKFQGRKELDKLLCKIKEGDTIIFDSVSRMSRSAEEGFLMYQELFKRGINLIFLKEPHINTDTYKKALQGGIPTTGTNVDFILDGINKYLLALAKEQIRLAFEQAEKEVSDLHQRTAEGIETARLAGKQIGQKPGAKLTTKKSIIAKEIIQKHNKSFGGSLNDAETIRQAGISRKTFYKYKKELLSYTVA